MIRVPTHREPTHPGEMLLEEFLKPMGISQRDLADGIRVPYQRVNELINRRTRRHPCYGATAGKVLWEYAGLLDEPAAPLGAFTMRSGARLQLCDRSGK